MGWKRFVRRLDPRIHTYETIKNIVDEKSLKKGLTRTLREDYLEDNPITTPIYNQGKHDGKKEGYVEASREYEAKLLKQANEFLKQKELAKSKIAEYEKLLDEYEEAISKLEAKVRRTEAENKLLRELLSSERQLRKLKVS